MPASSQRVYAVNGLSDLTSMCIYQGYTKLTRNVSQNLQEIKNTLINLLFI